MTGAFALPSSWYSTGAICVRRNMNAICREHSELAVMQRTLSAKAATVT